MILYDYSVPEPVLDLDQDVPGDHDSSLILLGVHLDHGSVPASLQIELDTDPLTTVVVYIGHLTHTIPSSSS